MHTQSVKNRKLLAVLFGLGLTALAVIVLAVDSSSATVERGDLAGDAQSSAKGEIAAGVSQFSILRPVDSVAPGEIPPSVASVLAEMPATEDGQGRGVVEALGTVVPTDSLASQITVAEVSGRLCVLATGNEYQGAALGSCFSRAEAVAGQGYVAIQGLAKDSVRVIGLAPDGVAKVAIAGGAGGEEVAVAGNVYEADVVEAPTTVSGLTAAGDVSFRTQLPLAGGAE